MGLGKIENLLTFSINKKVLQRYMKSLVDEDAVHTDEEKNNTKYYVDKDINRPRNVPIDKS